MEKIKKVIELKVLDEEFESGVSSISLVDEPAIEKYWVYMRNQKFVDPQSGESQSDFMSRCVPAMIDEGKDQDQAVAMCISMYENQKFEINVAGLPPYVEQVSPKKKKTNLAEEKDLADVCDEGYEAYGLKELGGRMVPNCVPIKASKLRKVEKKSKFSTAKTTKMIFAEEQDQHILVGAAMIPDLEIFRKDENGNPYYVKFSQDTIQKIQEKFMRETRLGSTNLDHNDSNYAGAYVFESWLVEDPKTDKANTVYKLDVPKGTWMVKMKVIDENVWQDIKMGKYRGFSIEGNFIDKEDYDKIQTEKEVIESIMKILNS
jgi:hypothetical protein